MSWFKEKVAAVPEAELDSVFKVTQPRYGYGNVYQELVGYYPTADAAFDAKIANSQVSKVYVVKVQDRLYEWKTCNHIEVKVEE